MSAVATSFEIADAHGEIRHARARRVEEQRLRIIFGETALDPGGRATLMYRCEPVWPFVFRFVNDALANCLGRMPAEFTGQPLAWLYQCGSPAQLPLDDRIARLQVRGLHCCDSRLYGRDDVEHCFRDEMRLLRSAVGQPLQLIGRLVPIETIGRAIERGAA